MYSSFHLAKKYLYYYLTASHSKGHGIHSPFVFDFILNVLNNRANYSPPLEIESQRKSLLHDQTILEIEDLGAGTRNKLSHKRSVAQLAKTSLKSKKYSQLLYRLVKHYQPQTIIELGTSLGITTSYLATANSNATVITIEGSKSIYQKAKENFRHLQLHNIQCYLGNFDVLLPTIIKTLSEAKGLSSIDLAYIDGNHRFTPTINYFHQVLQKKNDASILVFDDIHWSKEMEKAWEEIKTHPSVQYTIDIFFLGFVFFKKEFKEKQNFIIRF